ncbi:MAG TPA: hypothetical protein VJA26_04705 [Gammaproteobacteria bacterium]|nr:hypothetical protein [Gammaproteobacteria bacterium]
MSTQLNHDQAFELLPWLINGTLTGAELHSVESHVRDCLTCRLALREQHGLRAAIQAHPTVPLSAEQGFDRLIREMDRTRAQAPTRGEWSPFGRGFALSWTRFALAALGIAAVGIVAWLAATGGVERAEPAFTTLGRRAPEKVTRADDVRLDLIFATWVTETDMRVLLNEIDGTIVGGPSDLGRYTVRLNATTLTAAQVGELIERLGHDRRIRFAGRSLMEGE